MKLQQSLLLPVLIGAVSAASDASVYIFPGSTYTPSSPPPTLSAEEARLVFAQRLGAARYHGLGKASESTLAYINQFGGNADALFDDAEEKIPELVVIVEGISTGTAQPLLDAWSAIKPEFKIAEAPSTSANKELVLDFLRQTEKDTNKCYHQALEDAINPFDTKCWEGRSKIVHIELKSQKSGGTNIDALMAAQERIQRFAAKGEMNAVVVLMPEASTTTKSLSNPYGNYEVAVQNPMGNARRSFAEEPMTEAPVASFSSVSLSNKQILASNASGNGSNSPITGVPPLCHKSLDDCMKTTGNCSGRGSCYKKRGNSDKSACFACGCRATNETFLYNKNASRGYMLAHWGGSACQKRDVSEPFWLISVFTIVMVGLVSWGIGLLFSIGEEKLPGVIGAGVSSKAR